MARRSAPSSKSKRLIIPDFTVREWNGLNTYIKDIKSLKDGETPSSLNWITGQFKDHIELRRGYALLGTNRTAGGGHVSGIGVVPMQNGTQIPYFTYNSKILYYNAATNTTVESLNARTAATDVLGAPAVNDDVAIMPYQNTAGSFAYFTSPNSSIFKGAPSAPSTILDLNVKDYRGYAKIDTNRMYSWNRKSSVGISDQNDMIVGVVDKTTLSQYTQKTAQTIGTGDGSTKTFTSSGLTRDTGANGVGDTIFDIEVAAPIAAGTSISAITQTAQAQITSNSHGLIVGDFFTVVGVIGMTEINGLIGVVRQVVDANNVIVSIDTSGFTAYSSAGTIAKAEHFIDDKNGNMVSNLGGTGTINYISCALSVTFNTAPINAKTIYAQYYEEDSSTGGITDFTIDEATKGKGKIFPQSDGGGVLQTVWPFDQVQYCFHVLKTWYVNLTSDDTQATNLPYRSNFGIPYWRSAYPTPDGILVLDNSHPVEPKVRFLEISPAVAALIVVVPDSISDNLDLSSFGFNKCVVRRWGDFDLVAYENIVNGFIDTSNTLMLVRNIFSGQWDLVDYAVSCLDEFNGTLIAGDSLSPNVYTLFSGFDDDNTLINNYWQSKQFNLGVSGLKKLNRFVIQGLIQPSQSFNISFSYDSGNFTNVFTVKGTGSYVNTGNPVIVGADTIGSQVVGGGNGQGAPVIAYPYEVEIIIGSDVFEYIQAEFSANNIGYVSIDQFTFKDIRWKTRKVAPSRVIGN